jgi:transposase
LQVVKIIEYSKRGRPHKEEVGQTHYQISATLIPQPNAMDVEIQRAGRFILATNVLAEQVLRDQYVLTEYKAQQSTERGFRFLKDPLFFTSSIFLNTPQRVAAMAMLMGLCLLVYSLGQRSLCQALDKAQKRLQIKWVSLLSNLLSAGCFNVSCQFICLLLRKLNMSPTSPLSSYGFSSSLMLLAASIISFLDLPAECGLVRQER